jgi:hypothetical protein
MGSSPSIMERLAEMVMGYFSPGEGEQFTYEDLERRKKIAAALMSQAGDYSPVQSWTQGAARLASGLVGGLEREYANKLSKEGGKAYNEQLAKILSGGQSGGSMPSAAPSPIPTGGGSAAPRSVAMGGNQTEFVNAIMPHAMKVSEQTGLDPRLVIAQSALETGWGKSAPGNNFFGIKSHGRAGGNTMPTTEVVNGQPVRVNDSFRAYSDMGESAGDYAAFLRANPRYRDVLGAQGLDAQIEAMARSGYATDPEYGAKLRQIASSLQTPDGMPTTPVPSNAPPMSYAPGQQAIASAAPQQPAQGQRLAQAVTSPPIPAPQPTGNVQQAMMAVLSDPRFSPEQKRQAMQLYQMTQREQPKWEKLNDGTLYNPRTAETKGVGGGFKMLTDPNERARYGIAADDKRPYQIDPAGKLTGVGGSTTNVNVGGGSDKQIFDVLSESATAAKSAATGLNAIREARSAVEGGAILGAGADMRLGLAKVATALGVSDPSKVQNTETFRSAIAPQVAAMLKATVGSSQISNTDRDFAEKAAGGSITLDKGTILRLMDIMERGNLAVIQGHQERLDSVYDDPEKFKRERSLFGVKAPEARQAAPQSGQPVRVASPDEARKLPKGTKIILPDGREGVVP